MATDIIARGIAAGVVSQVSADRQAVSEDRAAVETAKTEVLNVAESIPEDYSTLSADVSELKEDLSQLYNYSFEWIDGKFAHKNGYLTPNSTYSYAKVNVSGMSDQSITFTSRYGISARYYFTDKSGVPISFVGGDDATLNNYTVTLDIPKLAHHLLVSCESESKNIFKFNFSDITNGLRNANTDLFYELYNTEVSFETAKDYFINESGGTTYLSGYDSSKFIPVTSGEKLLLKGAFINANANIAFYDSNQEFVSVAEKTGYVGTLENAKIIVTVPDGTSYMRFSFNASNAASVRYVEIKKSRVDSLENRCNKYDSLLEKNILFKSVRNVFINANGREEILSGYNSTAKTFVKSGSKVKITRAFINANANIAFYDKNADFLSIAEKVGYSGPLHDATITVTIPDNASYIRWAYNANYETTATYIEAQAGWLNYRPFECIEIEQLENSYNVFIKNALKSVSKPVATLVDDDSNATYMPQLKSICDAAGIKCSFGVIYTVLQNNANLLSTVKCYQEEGFHIMTHPDVPNSSWQTTDSGYNIDACESHVIKSISYLKSQGFLDCDQLVSPGGAHQTELKNVYKKWCPCAIGYNNGDVNYNFERGRYDIRRVFISMEHDLAYYKSKIDDAYARNAWIVFGTHSWELSTSGFSELVANVIEYAKAIGFDFKTFNEAWKDRKYIYDFGSVFN